jgi:hypothetical protein
VPRSPDHLALHVGRHQLDLLDQEVPAGLLAAQDEHGHREGRGTQAREVRGVALEGAKPLEAGLDRAGLRKGAGVEAAIGLGHGVVRVRGEVVPEVLEVGALAAPDQGQGHVP